MSTRRSSETENDTWKWVYVALFVVVGVIIAVWGIDKFYASGPGQPKTTATETLDANDKAVEAPATTTSVDETPAPTGTTTNPSPPPATPEPTP